MSESISIKDRIIEFMLNPDNDTLGKAEAAAAIGIDRKTLWKHEKELDWEWIKAERRRLYSREIIELDKALLKKAKGGDVRAIEIGYQRFDGWVPTQGMNWSKDTPDSAIEAEMQTILQRQKEKNGLGSEQTQQLS